MTKHFCDRCLKIIKPAEPYRLIYITGIEEVITSTCPENTVLSRKEICIECAKEITKEFIHE